MASPGRLPEGIWRTPDGRRSEQVAAGQVPVAQLITRLGGGRERSPPPPTGSFQSAMSYGRIYQAQSLERANRRTSVLTLPLIVGISGASGVIYGLRLLQALQKLKIPAHVVISKAASLTLKEETDLSLSDI